MYVTTLPLNYANSSEMPVVELNALAGLTPAVSGWSVAISDPNNITDDDSGTASGGGQVDLVGTGYLTYDLGFPILLSDFLYDLTIVNNSNVPKGTFYSSANGVDYTALTGELSDGVHNSIVRLGDIVARYLRFKLRGAQNAGNGTVSFRRFTVNGLKLK